jgi:hypothetical protein
MDLKEIIEYNEEQKFLYKLFQFKEEIIKLKGSSTKRGLKFYADYDFFTKIKRNYGLYELYEEFKKILNQILINNNLYFIEFKIQETNKKIKINYGEKFNFDEFKKNKNVEYYKIDIIIFNNNIFTESSSIYQIKDEKYNFQNELKKDIKEFKKEKNYFKVLKRIYSLKDYIDESVIEKIKQFFNSEYGKIYKNISNIEAIEQVKKYYNDTLTKKRIEYNLIDINYPLDYEEKYKKDKKILNDESKKIYEQIKKNIEF